MKHLQQTFHPFICFLHSFSEQAGFHLLRHGKVLAERCLPRALHPASVGERPRAAQGPGDG